LRKFGHEDDLRDVSEERIEPFPDVSLEIQPEAFGKIR
jgi:hypothetical protein